MTDSSDQTPRLPELPELGDVKRLSTPPGRPGRLPDGRASLLVGDLDRVQAQFFPLNGASQASGSLTAYVLARLLRESGVTVTPAELVRPQAGATGPTDARWPPNGLSLEGCLRTLHACGLAAHPERGFSLEDPAQYFESGQGTILLVNAGELWHYAAWLGNGDGNHIVVLAGLAYAPDTGELQGWYVIDPLGGSSATSFVEAERARQAWLGCGGEMIVCDRARD